MIYVSGCTTCNVEIKNLMLENGYVRVSGNSDSGGWSQGVEGIYYVNTGGITVDHNTIYQFGIGVDGWGNIITIAFNEVYECNWDMPFGPNVPTNGLVIHDNYLHDFVNWDGGPHHDGIFLFPNTGNANASGVVIYNNFFGTNTATGNTAYVYFAGAVNAPVFFNNLELQPAANRMPFVEWGTGGGGTSSNPGAIIVNNTAIMGCATSGCNGNYAYGPTPGYPGLTFKNNISVQGTALTFMSGDTMSAVDNNMYQDICTELGACGGIFEYATSTNSFTAWKAQLPSATGTDGSAPESHSIFGLFASLGVSATTGQLQAGSPGIGAGANLTSLGIAALDCDKPLIVGPLGTGTCNPRPSSGPWDIGAYAQTSSAGGPAAPSDLTASVQ
jgi:hypothetical protein